MTRNKLWYVNQKQQLYPLLANENPFHHMKKIKVDANKVTGTSITNLKDNYNHYILGANLINSNSFIHFMNTNSPINVKKIDQLHDIFKRFGLHTHQQLPDERLFLFRMLHFKALVWSRVNAALQLIGKPNIVERNSADLISHHDEILSEIILRQAEVVAGRALYAAQLDVGTVLLAISGTGTIAVRQIFKLEQQLNLDDFDEINQALRLWQINKARPQQVIEAKQYSFIEKQQKLKKINHSPNPLIIHNKVTKNELNHKNNDLGELIHEEAFMYERLYEDFLYDQDNELWLGADPELIFVNESDEMVPAVDVLIDDPQGRYGFDSVISQQKVTFPVAEVRPNPQQNPKELYYEIESILDEMHQQGVHGQFKWLAGGMPKGLIALGGHLHFSGVSLSSSLLRMLDACVGLTFTLVEDKSTTSSRRPKYGALGDFRRQEHGGFEYRTLPSWLISPQMTRAALALSYLVVKEHHQLKQHIKLTSDLLEDYAEGNIVRVREHVEHVFTVLEALPSYTEYAEWILPLKYMIKVGKRWNEPVDIKQTWKLVAYR